MAVVSRTSGFLLALALLVMPLTPLVAEDEDSAAAGQAPDAAETVAEEAPSKSFSMFDWLFDDDEAPEGEEATDESTAPEPPADAVVAPIQETPEATPETQASPAESPADEDEAAAEATEPAVAAEDADDETVASPRLIDKTPTRRYSIFNWVDDVEPESPVPAEGQPDSDTPVIPAPIESVDGPEAPAEPAEDMDLARESPEEDAVEDEADESEATEVVPTAPAIRPKYRVKSGTLDDPTPDLARPADEGGTERLGDAMQELRDRNPVVARVEGQEIRWAEVIESAEDLPVKYQSQVEAIFPALLDRVIDLRLLSIAARRDGLADSDQVRRQVAAYEDKLLRELYVSQRLAQLVTQEALHARYERLAQRLGSEQRMRARHILLESEAEAREVIAKLDDGEEFFDLARLYSIGPSAERGGDLGYFDPTRMVPEFSRAAAALEIGNFSRAPVQTPFGWHVIQLVDLRHSGVAPFSKLQDTLREQLTQEAMDEILSELRKDADLEVFPDLAEENPDRLSAVEEAPVEAGGEDDAPAAAPE